MMPQPILRDNSTGDGDRHHAAVDRSVCHASMEKGANGGPGAERGRAEVVGNEPAGVEAVPHDPAAPRRTYGNSEAGVRKSTTRHQSAAEDLTSCSARSSPRQ